MSAVRRENSPALWAERQRSRMHTSPERSQLMLVTDRERGHRPLLETVDAAVAGGVTVVQVREKDLSSRDRLTLALDVVRVCAGRAAVVINTDVAAAVELGIGLHLPDRASMNNRGLRANLAPGALIGKSIHSVPIGQPDDLDYLLLGHIFATESKPDLLPLGLETLAEAARVSAAPIWAIGGVTAENVRDILMTGARGVAVIGAILDADDPYLAARRIRTAMAAVTRAIPLSNRGNPHGKPER